MVLTKYHRLSQVKMDDEILQLEKRDDKITLILEQCVKYIAKKYITSPLDAKLVAFISTLIENSNFKKYQIDKLEVFIDVLKSLFPQMDGLTLKQSIEILELLKRAFHLGFELVKDVSLNIFLLEIKDNHLA
jgi:hypothetical protein